MVTRALPLLDGSHDDLLGELREFRWKNRATRVGSTVVRLDDGQPLQVPTFVNEFWTSRQRAAHSLHEVSYRACFKPQLPRFFIDRLTSPGDRVYDPFMGRGTTLLEAALMGRIPAGSDANPLSAVLIAPRLDPPSLEQVAKRLGQIPFDPSDACREELLVFYHPDTLQELCALRKYLLQRAERGETDPIDAWIRMVAVNRLTGHSPGFFSVYTLPPNQAVSIQSQHRINQQRQQTPPRRDVRGIILRKSARLLADCDEPTRHTLASCAQQAQVLVGPAAGPTALPDRSVRLVVTSPPFLDVVDYAGDNWLRCWFCGIDPRSVELTVVKRLEDWKDAMTRVFGEVYRLLAPGGHVAFEVGEVNAGAVRLEEAVIPCAARAGFEPMLVLVNAQVFTKTANCWGVSNNRKGTNTNRVVLLRKP